jgi:hypothetical protein
MKRTRQRKCLCCGELFLPDRRNAHHQRFCSKAGCRKASRHSSQRRWLAKPENRATFRGPENVARVKAWREAHPGYWRRKRGALQDLLPPQAVVPEVLATELPPVPGHAGAVSGTPSRGSAFPAQPVAAEGHDPAGRSPSGARTARRAFADPVALQDFSLAQNPAFVGLVSLLTGTLQDDMAPMLERLQTRGQAILGTGPGFAKKEA